MNINKSVIVGASLLVIWFMSPIVPSAFKVAGSLLGYSDLYAADGGDNYSDNYVVCGNGRIDSGEQCDDGNTQNGDGCSGICMIEPTDPRCGDMRIDTGEECDDGNTTNGDGCSATCQTEVPPRCGDGKIDTDIGETCDDGNIINGDGCSAICHIEPTPNLVAHYDFNGNSKDSSGEGNDGVIKGNINFEYMPKGNGYAQFDGTSDYVEVPHSQSLSLTDSTVSYWVKPNYKDYAGKLYNIVNKDNLHAKITDEKQGFAVVPEQSGDMSQISAPTNLMAEYGGMKDGKHVIYLSWDDNSNNEDGYVVEIVDQNSSCGDCPTQLPANATTYTALIDDALDVHEIHVYAYKSTFQSEKAVTLARLDGTEPDFPTPQNSSLLIPRDNKFHHVVQTQTADGVNKYYIDGKLITTVKRAEVSPGISPLRIGLLTIPDEIPSSTSVADGVATISWGAVAGEKYAVQFKETGTNDDGDPTGDSNWKTIPDFVTATDSIVTITDSDPAWLKIYRVLHIDGHAFKGALDEVMIYNRSLSETEVDNLYRKQKDQLRPFEFFIGTDYFKDLPEPQHSQAMDELEYLSKVYASAWDGHLPSAVESDSNVLHSYFTRRYDREVAFYKKQLSIMDKYKVLPGITANDIIQFYDPIWQEGRNNPIHPLGMASATITVKQSQPMQKSLAGAAVLPQNKNIEMLNQKAQETLQTMQSEFTKVAAKKSGPAPLDDAPPERDYECGSHICYQCSWPWEGSPCNCLPVNNYEVDGPAYPFVYLDYYCPATPPAAGAAPAPQDNGTNDCKLSFSTHVQLREFFTEHDGGTIVSTNDGLVCSPPSNHLLQHTTLSLDIAEPSRWDTLLFEGLNLTKIKYDIAPRETPTSLVELYTLKYWQGPTYDILSKGINNSLDGKVPIESLGSGLAVIVWNHMEWMGDGMPGSGSAIGRWMGSAFLSHPVQTKPLSLGDATYSGTDPITIKVHSGMDYIPQDFQYLVPDIGRAAVAVTGFFAQPGFTIQGPNLNVDFGADVSSYVGSSFATLKAHCDVNMQNCSFGIEYVPVYRGNVVHWGIYLRIILP